MELTDLQKRRAAYDAGFFDGEGSIWLQGMPDGQVQVVIAITEMVEEPLLFIQEAFGGRINHPSVGFYILGFRVAERLPLIEAIKPWCIVKREQILLLEEYNEWLHVRGRGNKWTPEQRTEQYEFVSRMQR